MSKMLERIVPRGWSRAVRDAIVMVVLGALGAAALVGGFALFRDEPRMVGVPVALENFDRARAVDWHAQGAGPASWHVEPNVGLTWFADADPTSSGVTAPLYQFLVRTDSPSLYYKSGALDTDWTQIGAPGGGGGGGTVMSVACGTSLSCAPGPITTSGTISLALTPTSCAAGEYVQAIDAAGNGTCAAAAGEGTVTSLTCGTGLDCSPNPVTTTGTVALANTSVTPGSYTNASITVDQQGRVTSAASGSGGITNSAPQNVLTKSDASGNLIASTVSDAGTGTVVTTSDFEIAKTTATSWRMTTRATPTTYPVAVVQPAQADTVLAVDFMPKGTPSIGSGGYVWNDICDADLIANSSAPVHCTRVAIAGSANLDSVALNGATAYPLSLMVNGTEVLDVAAAQVTSKQPLYADLTTSPATVALKIIDPRNSGAQGIITNTDAGTAAYAKLEANNDGSTGVADLFAMGTGYTSNGGLMQDSAVLYAGAGMSNGLSVIAGATTGDVRIYAGGLAAGNLQMTLAHGGGVTVDNLLTLDSGVTGLPVNACTAGEAVVSIDTTGTASCLPFGSSSLTNSAPQNVLTKSDASGNLIASTITDTGSAMTIANTSVTIATAGSDSVHIGNGASDTTTITGALTLAGAASPQLITSKGISVAGGTLSVSDLGLLTLGDGITGLPTNACTAGEAVVSIDTTGTASCLPFGSSSLTNSAPQNVLTKSDASGNLVASSATDNGTSLAISEPTTISAALTAGPNKLYVDGNVFELFGGVVYVDTAGLQSNYSGTGDSTLYVHSEADHRGTAHFRSIEFDNGEGSGAGHQIMTLDGPTRATHVYGALTSDDLVTLGNGITGLPTTSCGAGEHVSAIDTTGAGSCTADAGGITNSAPQNVLTKSDASGNLIASTLSDDGAGTVNVGSDLVKFGNTAAGATYFGNAIGAGSLNFGYSDAGSHTGYINYYGYNGAVGSANRNLVIADGNAAPIVTFTGSSKAAAFAGNISVAGGSNNIFTGNIFAKSNTVYTETGSLNFYNNSASVQTGHINAFGYSEAGAWARNLEIDDGMGTGAGHEILTTDGASRATEAYGTFTADDLVTLGNGITGLPTTSCSAGEHVSAIDTTGAGTCTVDAGGGITNSAPTNTIPKTIDGSGNLGASSVTDNGSTVQTSETLTATGSVLLGTSSANILRLKGTPTVGEFDNATLNFAFSTNATATGHINAGGYIQGTTQLRNLEIDDGKGSGAGHEIALFDVTGSAFASEFFGNALVQRDDGGVVANGPILELSNPNTTAAVPHQDKLLFQMGDANTGSLTTVSITASSSGFSFDSGITVPSVFATGDIAGTNVTGQAVTGSSGTPTFVGTECGTSPSVFAGNDTDGLIQAGSGTVTSCEVHFSTAYAAIYGCTITPYAAPMTNMYVNFDVGWFKVTASSNFGGEYFSYHCGGVK